MHKLQITIPEAKIINTVKNKPELIYKDDNSFRVLTFQIAYTGFYKINDEWKNNIRFYRCNVWREHIAKKLLSEIKEEYHNIITIINADLNYFKIEKIIKQSQYGGTYTVDTYTGETLNCEICSIRHIKIKEKEEGASEITTGPEITEPEASQFGYDDIPL